MKCSARVVVFCLELYVLQCWHSEYGALAYGIIVCNFVYLHGVVLLITLNIKQIYNAPVFVTFYCYQLFAALFHGRIFIRCLVVLNVNLVDIGYFMVSFDLILQLYWSRDYLGAEPIESYVLNCRGGCFSLLITILVVLLRWAIGFLIQFALIQNIFGCHILLGLVCYLCVLVFFHVIFLALEIQVFAFVRR